MRSFIRHRWAYFLAIGLIVVLSVSVILFQKRAYATVLTQEELRHYTQLAVIEDNIFIEQTRHLLSIISALPQVRGNDKAACSSVLADIVGDRTRYSNAGVVGIDGMVWCSAVSFTGKVNAGDYAYFKQALAGDQFAVGDYQISQITHQPVLSFGYPVHDSQGKTKAIAYLAVNLTWLEDFAKSANLPPSSSVTLIDNHGIELAGWPDPAIGQPAPEISYLFDRIATLEQGTGTIEAHDQQGKKYYVVATPLKRNNQEGYLHLIIAVPKENIDLAAALLAAQNLGF